ncbi:MAG: 4Fe-4S binding protein [Clostridia bacterium]|nr:4Fe-4S binding protein [Clostridia bacterium]
MKNDVKIPTLFERKEECCGCSACFSVCPRGAIEMCPDDCGFKYPVIDAEKCIYCGLCLKACPLKQSEDIRI